MIANLLAAGLAVILVALIIFLFWLRKRPRRLNAVHIQKQWREMQKLCRDKATWAQAVLDADKILDDVLKRKRFSGKTMGERLVSAQRILSDNDSVWFGHKLRNKLHDDPAHKPKEKDVKQALIGIRQAMKDLGALPGKAERDAAKETSK